MWKQEFWNKRRASSKQMLHALGQTTLLTGFIANIDYIEYVKPKAIEELLKGFNARELQRKERKADELKITTREDFVAAFLYCFSNGKGLELHSEKKELFEWFSREFKGEDERRLGGQAGIIANQYAALGGKAICYCFPLSREASEKFDARVLYPEAAGKKLVLSSIRGKEKQKQGKINWIFEFSKGQKIKWNGKTIGCPRSNRLIVVSRLKRLVPVFGEELEPVLGELAENAQKAMLAGFHHLHKEMQGKGYAHYLKKLLSQLRRMKKRGTVFHLEFVPLGEKALEKSVYPQLLENFDSLGINEVELGHLLNSLGFAKEAREIRKNENAISLLKGAEKLLEKFRNLKRVHVHMLGYHVLLLRKEYAKGKSLEEERKALVLSSLIASLRASLGKTVTLQDVEKSRLPEIPGNGFRQLEIVRKALSLPKSFLESGEIHSKDYIALVVPTPAAKKIKFTVGLGDTVSSVAFAAEPT